MGKLEEKKRPLDIVHAANLLREQHNKSIHLLFAGSGQLKPSLQASTETVFDPDKPPGGKGPPASFTGFLNQSEIVDAYVAADLLILPSDARETWGLVVNEALACGLPCIVSDQVGCAEDLVEPVDPHLVFPCGDAKQLATAIAHATKNPPEPTRMESILHLHRMDRTIQTAINLLS
jgi:glycosyltransferase involved in cell wall biosynthesis